MGNCDSATAEMSKRSRKINVQLEQDKKAEETIIKLLLLGAGESGKSTILKQMKIIHDNGFSLEEQTQKKFGICANVIQSMGALLNGMAKLQIPFQNADNEVHYRLITKILEAKQESQLLSDEIYIAVKCLWKDAGVQTAFKQKDDFYLHDSAEYFFQSLDRIHAVDYVPTQEDILRMRIATQGVIEVTFMMKEKVWRVFDVGGQRSQRKKWIHCFDDAKAIIYVASLSEYDQVLEEDNLTNRMLESLQLFKQVINNRFFTNTSVILFLNKKDIFEQKIGKGKSLRIAFPSYNGQENFEEGAKYIERKFNECNSNPDKQIYCHRTCATDTGQVELPQLSQMKSLSGSIRTRQRFGYDSLVEAERLRTLLKICHITRLYSTAARVIIAFLL